MESTGLLCREKEAKMLRAMYAHTFPEALFVFGPPQTGKNSLVSSVLDGFSDLECANVSCLSAVMHPRLVFEAILAQLFDVEQTFSSGLEANDLADFVSQLKKNAAADRKVRGYVIVLRKVEKLRDLPSNVLHGLLRLQELTKLNIGVILISCVSWSKFLSPDGLPRPIPFPLPQYTSEQFKQILASRAKEFRKDDKDDGKDYPDIFFLNYAELIVGHFLYSCNTLPQLVQVAQQHFKAYKEPVAIGKVEAYNARALHRNIAPLLQKACKDVHLRESSSQPSSEGTKKKLDEAGVATKSTTSIQRTYVELPFDSKFLLISAYLASHNPADSDKRFFMKNHGRQRKTKASVNAKEARTSSQLTGPQMFPLDRLMAIFYSINDQVAPSASIQSQISTLVTLGFLAKVGSEADLDERKYRCNVGLDFVEQIAKTVEFEIRSYLFDFV